MTGSTRQQVTVKAAALTRPATVRFDLGGELGRRLAAVKTE